MDIFSWILRLKGYKIDKASKVIADIRKLDRGSFLTWQTEKRWENVKWHFQNNSFYRQFVNNSLPSKWEELPELQKKDYQRPLEELLTTGFDKKQIYIGNTSGSSGHPFYYAKDKYCHALTWALVKQQYLSHNIHLDDLQARFYGIPLSGRSGFIERWKDRVMNRIRFPVFNLSEVQMDIYLERFKKNSFKYIYGYTNAVRHFADYLVSKNIVLKALCPSLKAVIVTSEMCTDVDKKLIAKGTGLVVINEYGASEIGIIAIDDVKGKMKVSEELLFLETNEKGQILITSFYNRAFPLIRYNIGDIATLVNDDQGLYIESIQGRSDDLVKLPGGKVAAGLTLYYCSRDILENSGKVKELYITQKTIEDFVVYYVADTDLLDTEQTLVQNAFNKYLQPGLKLHFERTDVIRRKINGKFQLFYSELA